MSSPPFPDVPLSTEEALLQMLSWVVSYALNLLECEFATSAWLTYKVIVTLVYIHINLKICVVHFVSLGSGCSVGLCYDIWFRSYSCFVRIADMG